MSEYVVCPYCHNPLSQSEYVKVVRCRDCKHSTGGGTCCWHFAYDELDGYNEWVSQPADVEPNGFCAWAERKEVDA